jgi:hypothetical protein
LIETLISICNAANPLDLRIRRNESISSNHKSCKSPLNLLAPENFDNFKHAVDSKNKTMAHKISMNSVQEQNYNNSLVSSGNTETLFSFKQDKQKISDDPSNLFKPSSKNSIVISQNNSNRSYSTEKKAK